MNVLKDIVEIPIYRDSKLTMGAFLGSAIDEIKAQYPMLAYDTPEEIVKISDYNKLAKLYGTKQYELNDNEYIMLCDFKTMAEVRNKSLKNKDNPLNVAGKQYDSKYEACQEGFIAMSSSHVNIGIMVVPDDCPLQEENKVRHFLAANYNGKTDEEKEKIEAMFDDSSNSFFQNLESKGIKLDRYVKNKDYGGKCRLSNNCYLCCYLLRNYFLNCKFCDFGIKTTNRKCRQPSKICYFKKDWL